jgi:O-acetylserine/cysteine efflux transporter
MTFPHILLAIAIMMVWGFNFVAAKVALFALPPFLLLALRFGLAGILLAPFVPRPHGRQWGYVAGVSFTLGVCHFSLMFTGLEGLDASTAVLASQIQVPLTALMAALFFKERLGWARALGMAVAIAGVAVVAGEPHAAGQLRPLLLVLGASFMWALVNVQIKAFRTPIDGLTLTAWISLLGAPQQAVVSALFEHGQIAAFQHAPLLAWAATLYMALFVTIFGYGLWYYLLHRHPINQVMAFTLLLPIFGVLSGVLVLGDPVTWRLVVGGVVTLLGVAGIVLQRPPMVASAGGGKPS